MRGIGYFISAAACATGAVLSPDWRVFGLVLAFIFAACGGYALRTYHRPVCDCVVENQGPRLGGAVYGCPVHDPEHTAERRQALKEAGRHAPGH